MPVSEVHRQVASIALGAAARHGFALVGGNALLAHGVITRPTQDVDLFTNQEHGVEAATRAVEVALRRAGFRADRQDLTGGIADIFPDMGEGLAEWLVTSPAGEEMMLQLAYFDRSPRASRDGPRPGPRHRGRRRRQGVCPASRIEPRDYVDTAKMLERYTPTELIGLARRLDPGLTARDFADAGRQLDRIDDEAFARYGLNAGDVAALRERFGAWPRTVEAAEAHFRVMAAGTCAVSGGRNHPHRIEESPDRPRRRNSTGLSGTLRRAGATWNLKCNECRLIGGPPGAAAQPFQLVGVGETSPRAAPEWKCQCRAGGTALGRRILTAGVAFPPAS
jgi:hypothetical protein